MAQSKEWSVTPGNKVSKTMCFDVRLSDVTTTTFTNKGQQITIITSNRFDNIFIYNFALFKKLFWLLRQFYHTWVTRVSLIPKIKSGQPRMKQVPWHYNLSFNFLLKEIQQPDALFVEKKYLNNNNIIKSCFISCHFCFVVRSFKCYFIYRSISPSQCFIVMLSDWRLLWT